MEGVCAQGAVVRCMSLGMAAFLQGGRATTPLQLNPALAVPREPREQAVLGRRDGVPLTEGSGDNLCHSPRAVVTTRGLSSSTGGGGNSLTPRSMADEPHNTIPSRLL
jgi:hypothetical protein